MADIRLITILPSPPVQGVQQQPQVSGNQSGQTGIINFQAGSILSGFIINRDLNGNPILRTDNGDITFSSNFFLKIGSEITIRIEHIAGNNSAHILSVNGQSPEVAVLQSGFTPEPEVIVSENLRDRADVGDRDNINTSDKTKFIATQTGQSHIVTVKGTIISPASSIPLPTQTQAQTPTQTPTPSPMPTLPNGSQLSLKIVSISATPTAAAPTPQTAATPTPQTAEIISQNIPASNIPKSENIVIPQSSNFPISSNATPATPTPSSYAAYTRVSAAIPSPVIQQQTPPPTVQQTVKTISVAQNIPTTTTTIEPIISAPLPIGTPPQTGQQITATVISNNPNGEAIIQTPLGIVRLQAGVQLPINSHITFEIEQIQPPETLEISKNTNNQQLTTNNLLPPAPLTQLARSAGALSNIFALLSGLGTSEALSFINKNIPTIGQPPTNLNSTEQSQPHNLLAPILTFTAALRSGDFREWLGRGNAKWLEDNGHENLLKKAEGEFSSLSHQFVDTPARGWQSLFFPIAIAGELQQTRLFIKRDRKQKENDANRTNEEDTRFVLEMDLSQLGEMQMDGFVRNNNKNIQFDLIIRNYIPLSQEIEKNILDIYNNIGELTGYQGSLSFQTVKKFPVNPMEDIATDNQETFVI